MTDGSSARRGALPTLGRRHIHSSLARVQHAICRPWARVADLDHGLRRGDALRLARLQSILADVRVVVAWRGARVRLAGKLPGEDPLEHDSHDEADDLRRDAADGLGVDKAHFDDFLQAVRNVTLVGGEEGYREVLAVVRSVSLLYFVQRWPLQSTDLLRSSVENE